MDCFKYAFNILGEGNLGIWIQGVWFLSLYARYMVDRSLMQTQPEHLTGMCAQEGRNKCIEHKRAPRGQNGLLRLARGLWVPNAAHRIASARNIAPGGGKDRRINELLRWRRGHPGNTDCSGSVHRISIFILARE